MQPVVRSHKHASLCFKGSQKVWESFYLTINLYLIPSWLCMTSKSNCLSCHLLVLYCHIALLSVKYKKRECNIFKQLKCRAYSKSRLVMSKFGQETMILRRIQTFHTLTLFHTIRFDE